MSGLLAGGQTVTKGGFWGALMELGFLQMAGILVVAVSVLAAAFTLAWIDATLRNTGGSLD